MDRKNTNIECSTERDRASNQHDLFFPLTQEKLVFFCFEKEKKYHSKAACYFWFDFLGPIRNVEESCQSLCIVQSNLWCIYSFELQVLVKR